MDGWMDEQEDRQTETQKDEFSKSTSQHNVTTSCSHNGLIVQRQEMRILIMAAKNSSKWIFWL
jgi:hypothetical protein